MLSLKSLAQLALALLAISPAAAQQLVASSNTSDVPSQQRLAYAGPGKFSISWSSQSELSPPQVQFGSSPSDLSQSAQGVSSTYDSYTLWDNKVVVDGLQPNTTYFYAVSNSNSSQVFNFTTAPVDGTNDEFVFAMVNDMGTFGPLGLSDKKGKGEGGVLTPGELTTIDSLVQFLPEYKFVWHIGDIAYADYWLKEENQLYLPNSTIEGGFAIYNEILNAFYDEITPIAASVPYMVGPGNHDGDCVDGTTSASVWDASFNTSVCVPGQKNFTGYLNHWRMPGDESSGFEAMWYSFNYGNVHFIQLNTETDLGDGIIAPDELGGSQEANSGPFAAPNTQIEWLKNDLGGVNRTETPWVIVGGHRPWYQAVQAVNWEDQVAFEQILLDSNVDVVLHGHVHNYERMNPTAFNQSDPNGLNNPSFPWYIVNGIGGHYDGIDPLVPPIPDYVAFAQATDYGWSRFTVHNCTHLTHEFVSASNGSVIDTATLFKNHTGTCAIADDSGSAGGAAGAAGSNSTSSSNITTGGTPPAASASGEAGASGAASGSAAGSAAASNSGSQYQVGVVALFAAVAGVAALL